nr:pyridoxal-dependent decarboxylase [Kofleriaceae bacterium]
MSAPDDILGELAARAKRDVDYRGGRVFSLVYHAGAEHEELLARAHALYASANLLNPMAFPELAKLEREVVAFARELMHGSDRTGGVMTSGGTESILCAVAAYRARARRERPWASLGGRPELVVPATIHPAFDKAAHWFGVALVKVPVGADLRADAAAMARACGRRTIGLVASAPQYPHGVVDPIADIAAIATARGLPMHVDACVGGFVLPWLERLGRDVPRWDFRVPGVTSISADLHKYAYAGKGASLLMWRDARDVRDQVFVATDFPGGIYASPTMIGTRPGGPIAAAWAATRSLGADLGAGYLRLARAAAGAADRLRAGIAAIDGLEVLGDAHAPIVAYGAAGALEPVGAVDRARGSLAALLGGVRDTVTTIGKLGSDDSPGNALRDAVGAIADRAATAIAPARDAIDVFAVADRLESRGWTVDRMHRPNAIHLTVTAAHEPVVDRYLADLAAAVSEVRADPSLSRTGNAPMYGMAAALPARGLVARNVRDMIAEMYRP